MIDFDAFKAKYQHAPVKEYPNRVCEVMPEPMVSVHVSTYQHADFIRDCLDGVLMQETDFSFEIIIGEDESEDGTREICKEYADQHPDQIRLFLHRRENNIAIHGRPTGRFQFTYSHFVARGKYIAICEGDDYWTDPLKLQKQVDFLEANPEYVLSHHDASIVDTTGKQLSASKLPDDNKRDFSREGLMKGPFLLTLSLCFRNVVESYPEGFFRVMNGDKFLISLVGQYGKGAYQEEIEPAVYRTHDGSMWSTNASLSRAEATNNTLKELLVLHSKGKLQSYFEDKVLYSCISFVSRLIAAKKFKKAFVEFSEVITIFAKSKKINKIFCLVVSFFGFQLGRIKQKLLK